MPTGEAGSGAEPLHRNPASISRTQALGGGLYGRRHLFPFPLPPAPRRERRRRLVSRDVGAPLVPLARVARSEEHTSELQSLMRISYAVFCLKKKKQQ